MLNNKPLRRLNEKWPWKVKVTVVDNKLYPESASECCDYPDLDALFESHQSLYMEYFGDNRPCFYEWLAVEWAAGLLMQAVSIAGGRLAFDEFDCCEYVDLYGVYLLMDRLENIAAAGVIPPLQEITQSVQSDLRRARSAKPEIFASLQKEYLEYTIAPKEYAEKLLDY